MYRSVAFNRIHRNDDDDDPEYDKHEPNRTRHYAARASWIAHLSSNTPSFSSFPLPSAH